MNAKTFIKNVEGNLNEVAKKFKFNAKENSNFMRKFSTHEALEWMEMSEISTSDMGRIAEAIKSADKKLISVVKKHDYDYTCPTTDEEYIFLSEGGFLRLINPVWWYSPETGKRGCHSDSGDANIVSEITLTESDTPWGDAFKYLDSVTI